MDKALSKKGKIRSRKYLLHKMINAFCKKLNLRRIGYAVLLISFFVFVLSLYLFLEGPVEKIVSLNYSKNYEVLLIKGENKTIYLSPFVARELVEYYDWGLLDLLINRTINIQVKTENMGKVDLYIMNYSQFEQWLNDSLPYGEISREKIEYTQLTFSPKDVWEKYFLILINTENIDFNVSVEVHQQFFIKKLDYSKPFMWLEIAFVSSIPLFALQIPLRLTFENIMDRIVDKILNKILPVTYRKYVFDAKPPSISLIVVILLNIIFLISIIPLTLKIDENFSVVNQIYKDYLYRIVITLFLITIFMLVIGFFAFMIWSLFRFPLLLKYYSNFETFKKREEVHLHFLKKLLIKPYSILFHIMLFSSIFLMSEAKMNYFILFMLFAFLLGTYFGYVDSLAYFKTIKRISIKPINDFKYSKSAVGSVVITSIILLYNIQIILPSVNLILKYILDKSALISYNSISSMKSAVVADDIVESISYLTPFAAFIPLGALVYYYSFELFSVVYFPKKKEFKDIRISKEIVEDSKWSLTFFLVVFVLNLWLQSLFVVIDLQKVLISLFSSFIASSFRDYLIALKT